MSQLILTVVLDVLLFLMHVVCAAIIVFWRRKKFRRQIHRTGSGVAFYMISLIIALVGVLETHLFFQRAEDGIVLLFFCVILCPIGIAISLHDCCFCVFVDGEDVVLRTLMTETRINLSMPGTVIDDQGIYGCFTISIVSNDGEAIQFNRRKVSGDIIKFLESCKSKQRID